MIRILCVGKKHDDMYLVAINHYEDRIKRVSKLEWVIVPGSEKGPIEARQEETTALLAKINPGELAVLLDESGQCVSSPDIAKIIESAQNKSQNVTVIIGGAYGVDDRLKERANHIIAFGRVVFPHQLMRVLVLEQLYRAHSILAGSKYHHE